MDLGKETGKPMKHVLYAADAGFYHQLYVSAFSLCENQMGRDYILHVIEEGFSDSQKEELRAMIEAHGQRLVFHEKPILPEQTVVMQGHSPATYYRLGAAALLPEEVETVLYLDGDTVIEDSLDSLFQLDLKDAALAGVQDTRFASDLKTVGMSAAERYINAGVLLLNLKKWREDNLEARFADCLAEWNYRLPYNDQDVLNIVCRGKTRILPLRYNVMIPVIRFSSGQIRRLFGLEVFYEEEERKDAAGSPAIIHYAGTPFDRPWNDVCDHPLRDRFWAYAGKAERDFPLNQTSLSRAARLRRKCFRFLPLSWQLAIRTGLKR